MSASPATVQTARRSSPRVTIVLRFAAHYVEMLLVMGAGMLVLGVPLELVIDDSTALKIAVMGISMTLPMIGWMWWRGHSAAANREMAAAMIVPTLGTLALLAAGVVEDLGGLMTIEHTTMFTAMFGVMLYRRDEYTHPLRGTK